MPDVNRAQLVTAVVISALVASVLLALVAWMTSGTWPSARIEPFQLAIVFPMALAVNLGWGRAAALAASFLVYWAFGFALLAWYIRRTSLELRKK